MKAYVTLLSTNSNLDGVLALNQSLIDSGAQYPLVVVVTKNITPASRKILQKKRLEICEIEEYTFPEETKRKLSGMNLPHWYFTSNKLKIFGLTQFEKIVYIDSDMLVLKNIDTLFDKPHMTAAEDSPMTRTEEGDFNNLNSGLLVIEPKEGLDLELIKVAEKNFFPDQDILRLYFSDWKENKKLHLPQTYNIFVQDMEKYRKLGIDFCDIYVFHFIGKIKPFMKEKDFPEKESLVEKVEEYYRGVLSRATKELKGVNFW